MKIIELRTVIFAPKTNNENKLLNKDQQEIEKITKDKRNRY